MRVGSKVCGRSLEPDDHPGVLSIGSTANCPRHGFGKGGRAPAPPTNRPTPAATLRRSGRASRRPGHGRQRAVVRLGSAGADLQDAGWRGRANELLYRHDEARLEVVADRFGEMAHDVVDEVRAAEARKLAAAGKAPVLKHSRWLLLKCPEHLTDAQEDRLADLVRRNLRTVRAYLLKEDFQSLWGYVSPYWAGNFLDRWCTRTMRSRLDPMKEVARMVRSHRDLILNWFRARGQFSSGVVEGFNGKARVITKRAYGFRTPGALEVALYHALGDLPEPELTHRFC